VRAVYLVTAITGLLLVLVAFWFGGFVLWWAWLAFIPAVRAIRRRIVSGTVLPAQLVGERPAVAFIVTLAGVIAFFFKVIVATAGIDLALATEWPDEAGKIASFAFAAMFFDAIALLCGELALVGNGKSDVAAEPRSGPFC
jgi:hypothetical protein